MDLLEAEGKALALLRDFKTTVDDTQMSDQQFRRFVRNNLQGFPEWFWKTSITSADFLSKKESS